MSWRPGSSAGSPFRRNRGRRRSGGARSRRSMRSPVRPLPVLMMNLKAPLTNTEAVEQHDRIVAGGGPGQRDPREQPGRALAGEAVALDALVDDPFRQIEGKEIERQRDRHREHDQQLLALAVASHILEKIGFHPPRPGPPRRRGPTFRVRRGELSQWSGAGKQNPPARARARKVGFRSPAACGRIAGA